MKIGFIGTGVMGAPMAGHLVKQGHTVQAWNRTYEKMLPLAETYGFKPCETLAEAVRDAEVVFTMVGFPRDVEDLYLRDGGLFDSVGEGTVIIDLTTSSPTLAEQLAAEGGTRGISVLDAPVSGGDSGAKAGTLVTMVGGDRAAYDKIEPLLLSFSKSCRLMGPAGAGQHTKAANQIAVAGATAAYTEAMAYTRRVGLDPQAMFEVIGGGAAGSWQIENMAPRAMSGDFAPGFFIKHFIKDMNIAKQEAERVNLELPALNTVLDLYRDMAENGLENDGTQALIKCYEDRQ